MRYLNQKGVTLVEMVVTIGIIGVLGLILVNVSRYAERQTQIQTEDVQNMIAKLGASKILTRDLVNATPSFNYINLEDDFDSTPQPFFTLAKNEYCSTDCKRTYSLNIPTGATVSKPFFAIVVRGFQKELVKLPLNPKNVFAGPAPHAYVALNRDSADINQSISKSTVRPDSPWTKGRLMMLTSKDDYYDCYNKTKSLGETAGCTLSCPTPGACDYVAKRELKLLGVVNTDERDMTFYQVASRPTLLKRNYNLCNINETLNCSSYNSFTPGLSTSKVFFEKMPFIPGHDNGAFLSPVELVRYHLERPIATSPDHKIVLVRSVATLSGGSLSFERGHILMSGVQSIVFTRNNISNPTIEYKIVKARLQQSIK